jgi:Xaa-Pro dipeptidase
MTMDSPMLNRERALAYMREHELEAIVAVSPVNVRYFTDYACWLAPLFREYMTSPGASSDLSQRNFALFPLEGEPALVVEAMWAATAADSWVRDIHVVGDGGFELPSAPSRLPENLRRIADAVHPARDASAVDALTTALEQRGLHRARIGVELEAVSTRTAGEISDHLPRAQILDCTNVIRLIRAVKSEAELARLEHAATIAERAAHEALAAVKPGSRAGEAIECFRAALASAGADFDHFALGPRGVGMTTKGDYTFADLDAMYLDFGCIYEGYFSDTGTTICLGSPPESVRERHRAVRACLREGSRAIRPGVTGSQVCSAMWDALSEHGVTKSFPHGHGIGLEVRDYPIIVPDNGLRIQDDCIDVPSDLPFEAGMAVNLEAAVFILGEASIHTEQAFVVTPDGVRSLTDQEREQPLVLAASRA